VARVRESSRLRQRSTTELGVHVDEPRDDRS
jgi:hypothetical protein